MNEKRLIKVSDRIYYFPCEDDRDRPLLGYIRGDHYALAVDAGHSAEHVDEFYRALTAEGLSLPDFTVLTHWHWDHTFGMHAVHGLTIANSRTGWYLQKIHASMNDAEKARYLAMDEHIALEYASGQEMKVVPPHIEFDHTMTIDLGNISVLLSTAVSPHTEDTTLILVPDEKALFFGDCICGTYPDWTINAGQLRELVYHLDSLDFISCFGGHWDMDTKDALLQKLAEDLR